MSHAHSVSRTNRTPRASNVRAKAHAHDMRPFMTAMATALLLAMTMVFTLFASTASAADTDKAMRQQLTAESTIEQVLERGVLRVGFSTFVPWAMQDKSGEFVGFEIDVARRLAQDLGVKLELVPTKWAGMIPALLTGKFDVIIGGMSVTMERNLKVNFTVPYDYAIMDLVANKKLAGDFTSLEDFNNPDVIIAVRTGSTAATAAKRAFPKATFRYFEDEGPSVQELLMNRAHALVATAPLPAFEAIKHDKKLFRLPVASTALGREPIAFAIGKSDINTLNVLDNWIRTVQAQGWLAERKAYWFESLDWKE